MLPIIRERRNGDGDDLLSRLCRAEVDGEHMSDEEIKAFVSLLLVAGGETTDKAIASMMTNLIKNPDQLEAVRADRSLVDAAIAETLRYSGPVHMIMRQTEQPVEIERDDDPRGRDLHPHAGVGQPGRAALQRPRPVRHPPHRPGRRAKAFSGAANHVQFILGRHFCVGSLLARTEMQVALDLVLDNMPNLRFQEGFTPRRRSGSTPAAWRACSWSSTSPRLPPEAAARPQGPGLRADASGAWSKRRTMHRVTPITSSGRRRRRPRAQEKPPCPHAETSRTSSTATPSPTTRTT